MPASFNPTVCPAGVKEYGIDCTCPFKLKAGMIDINQNLNLPDASKTVATFLASGDFEISFKAADSKGPYSCVNLKFTVKPNK